MRGAPKSGSKSPAGRLQLRSRALSADLIAAGAAAAVPART